IVTSGAPKQSRLWSRLHRVAAVAINQGSRGHRLHRHVTKHDAVAQHHSIAQDDAIAEHYAIAEDRAVAEHYAIACEDAVAEHDSVTQHHAITQHNSITEHDSVAEHYAIPEHHTHRVVTLIVGDQRSSFRIPMLQDNALRPRERVTGNRRLRIRR